MIRRHLPNLALLFGTLLILWLIAEAGYLAIRYAKFGTIASQRVITRDLGWRTTPNYESGQRTWTDLSGEPYERSFRTGTHGFREWGAVDSESPRFLFVGDSYTECNEVSNEHTYYRSFQNNYPQPVEIFAYGGGGYGSLQEYLIIDQHIDEIKPTAVVLQFCSNDWQNNSLELETKTVVISQTIRPYLADANDEIQYRFSSWHPYLLGLRISGVVSFVDTRIQRVRAARNGGSYFVETPPPEAWDRSVAITERIFQKIRERVPAEIPVYVFSCATPGTDERYGDYVRIARNQGLQVLPDLMSATSAEGTATKREIRALDGAHLNNAGNEILGRRLATEIFRAESR